MASRELDELVRKAEQLTADEQLALIAHLARRVRDAHHVSEPRRQWREICGSSLYPLLGEDVQTWVSRTRHDSNEHRERQG